MRDRPPGRLRRGWVPPLVIALSVGLAVAVAVIPSSLSRKQRSGTVTNQAPQIYNQAAGSKGTVAPIAQPGEAIPLAPRSVPALERGVDSSMANRVFEIEIGTAVAGHAALPDLHVKEGDIVSITLRNESPPELHQQHDLVLVPRDHVHDVASEAIQVGPSADYVPESSYVLAATSLVSSGESATVTFRAPPAGDYRYICTFPGHAAGENGSFKVER